MYSEIMTHSESVHPCAEFKKTGILTVLTDTSGLRDIYIKDDDSCCVKMFIYLPFMLYINYAFIDHVVMGTIATLLPLIAKHDIHLKATYSLTSVSYFEPHEPLAILLSTTCAHPWYLPHTSGWTIDQDWNEDYRDEY
jgi:hypothetical protein